MKNKKLIIMLPILTLFSSTSYANSKTLIFDNINCKKTDSCDLKKMQIKTTRSFDSTETQFGGDRITSHTSMEGYYETTSIDVVEEYAIVQFIKGGVFTLEAFDQEELEVFKRTSREFFGKNHFPFTHPEWVVDSFDDDPIYASYSDQNDRHGLYRIKSDESRSVVFDDSKYYEYYFYRPTLKIPRMHFSDMPTGGSYNSVNISAGKNAGKTLHSARNASMTFKTCIYKTSDISRNAGPNDIDIKKAIGCLEWDNHHILNKDKSNFLNLKKLDNRALR